MYDVIIIGGGPAGAAAAVYAARKKMKTLLITDSFGGQSIVSNDIQNWIGEPHISGFDLAKKFEEHVRIFSEIEIKTPAKAIKISEKNKREDGVCDFEVETENGEKFDSKTIILATGARRKKLGIPGEDEFDGKGVAFCSTCDAPLFTDKRVAVVGGGNAGLEAVIDLFPYASEIYLFEKSGSLKGDQVSQVIIKENPKLKNIFMHTDVIEIKGNTLVSSIVYKNTKTGEEKEFPVDGIFIEIGSIPNSDMVKNLISLNKEGEVLVDSKMGTTSKKGIFAAGDVTDDPYKQNNISAGDAVKAALAAYNFLITRD